MPNESHIHLGVSFGLEPSQAQAHIKDLPAWNTWPAVANSINNAKVRYPDAYEFLRFKNWSDEKFLNLSAASAAAVQAVYSGQYKQWGVPCMSRVNVDVPDGEYFFTTWFPFCMGQYLGQGPHAGWNPTQAATNLRVWKEKWQEADPHQMAAMRSTNFGIDTGGEAWVHGGSVDLMGFKGNNSNWYDPKYTEHGLVLWDLGEASAVGRIWCTDWNGYGVEVARGTPFTANCVISTFTNALGGVGIMDGQLGTFNFGTISGDDSPALVVFDSKYGRGAGGNVNIDLFKVESGKRVPNKGQIAIWQKAPCVGTINIGICQADQNDRFNDAAFVMKSREWGQTLNVGGFVGWNLRTLVHDVTNQKRWATSAYHPMVFTWASRNGGSLTDHVDNVSVPGTPVIATDRLGMVPNNGVFDYANGTPGYSITGDSVVVPPAPGAPVIDTFVATPGSLAAAGSVVLSWSTTNATAVTIAGITTPLAVDGSVTVAVTATSTYSLTATGPGGTTTRNLSVIVSAAPPVVPGANLDRTGWSIQCLTAGANPLPMDDGTHLAGMAIDSDLNSWWHAGVSMQAGQKVIVDMKARKNTSGVSFAVPPGYNLDYPTKFTVRTRATATSAWVERAKDVSGGATSTALWATASVRFVEITCNFSRGSWWGMSDLQVRA